MLVPRAFAEFALKASNEIMPSIQQHIIQQNVRTAQQNANNPAVYRYHMVQAEKERHASRTSNDNIDSRIDRSLHNTESKRLDTQLQSFRRNPQLLKTDLGMRRYRTTLVQKDKVMNTLRAQEQTRFSNFVNNPQNSLQEVPHSLTSTPYHNERLSEFFSNPNVIHQDERGHTYVEGKKVSTSPNTVQRMIHFVSNDYQDTEHLPEGVSHLLHAFHKRGFAMHDIGNKFLRQRAPEIVTKAIQEEARARTKMERRPPSKIPRRIVKSAPTTPVKSVGGTPLSSS